jgi:4-hydroxy-2-oxoheptanedioate aldolase
VQEDAARIVSFSKYPPLGTRGYGPMFANHTLPGVSSGPVYDNGQKDGLLVIVQIESAQGLENVEKIAPVEGVDVVFVGKSKMF